MSARHFAALLRSRAATGAAEPLYSFLDADGAVVASLGAAALLDEAGALARRLAARGAAGRPVLAVTGPGREAPVALFGCFLAGAVATPLYPPAPENPRPGAATIAAVARASRARVLVTTAAIAGLLGPALAADLGEDAPEVVLLDGAEDAAAGGIDHAWGTDAPDEVALLLYTSGSTGQPKGVPITHAGLLANMEALRRARRHGRDEVVCSWLPHANIAGLYLRLYPLVIGGGAVLSAPGAVMARPARWLEAISRHRATISAAPDFAYALAADAVDEAAAARLDLSSWRMAISGGEAVRASTLDRFAARFAPAGFAPDAFAPYYGLTETLCTSVPDGAPPMRVSVSREALTHLRFEAARDEADARMVVGNGSPLACDVAVVDPARCCALPAGRVGEIWTRGPGVTAGYWGAEGDRPWEGRLPGDARPWFRTGDMGAVHGGQVFITGRLKEILVVRGKNHDPADIEATCLAAAAGLSVKGAGAFSVTRVDEEALGLAFEVAEALDASALLRAVRPAVARAHGLAIAAMFLLPPGGLPRTVTGKVARHGCRARAEGGGWGDFAVSDMRRAPTASALAAPGDLSGLEGPALAAALTVALSEFLAARAEEGGTGLDLDRPVAEMGLSSLTLARLVAEIRRLTGVEPALASLFGGSSLREVAAGVARLRSGGAVEAAADWREDVYRLARALPDHAPAPAPGDGAVFLTGATGFLGAWLAASLLETGTREVVCLVRCADAEAGRERLRRALAAGPGWRDAWAGRIRALPGDVAAPRLGLDEGAFEALAGEASVVLHNAADVNFVAPYGALAASNVRPMHELVRLAGTGGRARALHLVSTLAVFNDASRREQRLIRTTDRLTEPDHLYSGYAQTKWAAEAMARLADTRGIPVALHRPGLIVGASTDGRAHAGDFLCRFIKGCIELGRFPDAAVELDLVPVDEVARGIALAVEDGTGTATWHWSAARPVLLAELFDVFRRRGHAVAPQPVADWLADLQRGLPVGNALFPVHPFLLERPPGAAETILELLDGLPLMVETVESVALFRRHGVTTCGASPAVLDRMATWMERSGFLPTP